MKKTLVFSENIGYNILYEKRGYHFLIFIFLWWKGCEPVNNEQTMNYSVYEDKETELKKNLTLIYDALREKGYNPINQIVGYILSEDPTYITTYNNARSLVRHIDRDELLQVLVKSYLGAWWKTKAKVRGRLFTQRFFFCESLVKRRRKEVLK